jgi:hypothetical protein
MSLFGGGGSKTVYVPTPAPPPPVARSTSVVDMGDKQYKSFISQNASSYASTILGGASPAPKKSYASALFGGGGL